MRETVNRVNKPLYGMRTTFFHLILYLRETTTGATRSKVLLDSVLNVSYKICVFKATKMILTILKTAD